MTTTCIENNKIFNFPGVVFLDKGSTLSDATTNNYGDNNTGKKLECQGIFKDTLGGGQCSVFDASSCPLNPQPNITCFTDWKDLSQAISKNVDGGVFTICKKAILDVSLYPEPQITPIVINKDKIVIRCGNNGSPDDDCKVLDGNYHFRIELGTGIEFSGITFAQAGIVSISIEKASRAMETVEVDFVQCIFKVSNCYMQTFLV